MDCEKTNMSTLNLIVLCVGGPLLIVFLIFAFRQGEKVKPSGRNPDAGVMDARDLSRNP
jgi:hypothetical protein